jgi:hypothetical protein
VGAHRLTVVPLGANVVVVVVVGKLDALVVGAGVVVDDVVVGAAVDVVVDVVVGAAVVDAVVVVAALLLVDCAVLDVVPAKKKKKNE